MSMGGCRSKEGSRVQGGVGGTQCILQFQDTMLSLGSDFHKRITRLHSSHQQLSPSSKSSRPFIYRSPFSPLLHACGQGQPERGVQLLWEKGGRGRHWERGPVHTEEPNLNPICFPNQEGPKSPRQRGNPAARRAEGARGGGLLYKIKVEPRRELQEAGLRKRAQHQPRGGGGPSNRPSPWAPAEESSELRALSMGLTIPPPPESALQP